jgi:predicted tellurium resistance membrane protein TerC
MIEIFLDPQVWISLLTLTLLEIVLGIDNIIFIAILAGRLPKEQQSKARRWGLAVALISRLFLLGSLAFIVKLTSPWFTILGQEISGRDLILILGGLFLIYKSTKEIHHRFEEVPGDGEIPGESEGNRKRPTFSSVVGQIMVLDIIFSLDSVITAVGMATQLWVMTTAVILAVVIMLLAVNPISLFVEKHPTVKMLALSFLLMVGMVLVADGLDFHIPKGYVYSAMAFSVLVETLNIRAGRPKIADKKS